MTMSDDNTDETTDEPEPEPTKAELHERVEQLESTVAKMMPSRRDALKLGAAGIAGAAGLSATSQPADASTGSAGTIGSQSDRPDAFLDEANVNQLTGVSTGGKTTLKSGDNVKVATISQQDPARPLRVLIDQPNTPFKLYTGVINMGGGNGNDWEYTFNDGSTINRIGGTGYDIGKEAISDARSGGRVHTTMLPPATNLVKVRVGGQIFTGHTLGAEAIYADL